MTALTNRQADAMMTLGNYVGRSVQVLTSEYTANVSQKAVEDSVGTFKSATLYGLQARGLIKINLAYWKGANITVLAAA